MSKVSMLTGAVVCIAMLLWVCTVQAAPIPINTNTLAESLVTGQPLLGKTVDLYMFQSVQYDSDHEGSMQTYTVSKLDLNGAAVTDVRGQNDLEIRMPGVDAFRAYFLPAAAGRRTQP